jgi:hypothetical protein
LQQLIHIDASFLYHFTGYFSHKGFPFICFGWSWLKQYLNTF